MKRTVGRPDPWRRWHAPALPLLSVATVRPASGQRTPALGLRVFLRRSRLELESDEPLVADRPCVVAGLNDVRLARTDLDLGPVLVLDGQPAEVDNADMASLAALSSGDGLDTFRPAPPGSNVMRAAVVTPIRTTSTCVLSGVLVSSGASKSRDSTPGTAVSFVDRRIDPRALGAGMKNST